MKDYYIIEKILKIEHLPNSQTFAITHGNDKNDVKDDNYEYLLLGKAR